MRSADVVIEKYRRDAKTNLAPPELRAIHPLGKSPVIQDGDLVLAESGAIIEYLLERHGSGRLVPTRARTSMCAICTGCILPKTPSCCTWWRGSILAGRRAAKTMQARVDHAAAGDLAPARRRNGI